jgi:hypothetical protein
MLIKAPIFNRNHRIEEYGRDGLGGNGERGKIAGRLVVAGTAHRVRNVGEIG